jgi:hypothetical protein
MNLRYYYKKDNELFNTTKSKEIGNTSDHSTINKISRIKCYHDLLVITLANKPLFWLDEGEESVSSCFDDGGIN